MTERISAGLKLADSQKEGLSEAFKQSIQLINRQQSDLEAHFDSIRKFIEERCEELDSKEKQLGSAELLLEQRSKELESREKAFDVTRLEYEKKSTELLDLQERVNGGLLEVESREKELESLQQTVERRLAELQSKEKLFDLRCKEVESRETRCEELSKQLELREAGLGKVHAKVKVEQEEVWASNDGSNSLAASLQFSVTMDGRCLQIFLNEHVDDHDSMRDEVFVALRMSANPGKLVLDALEGFYPPHLKKGDKEFQTRVVQRSCTLLLAQLMRISPKIRRCVKEEAAKVAVDWKARLTAKFAVDRKIELEVQDENSLEVLGFLQLIGIYGLVSGFDSDEVLKLLETIAWHREAPELFGVLGFVDMVPGVVQGLIGRRQNPAAIRLIHAFKLVREFPPGPILENYFKYWKKISDEIFKSKNFTGEQIRIAKNSIDALRVVIKCIEDHKFVTEIVPMEVEKHILLLTEKAESKCAAPSETNPQPQQQSGKKCSVPIVSAHKDQNQRQKSGKKCSALIVSAHKDQDQRQQSGKNCSAPIVSAHKDQDQRQQSGKNCSAPIVSAHKDQDQRQQSEKKYSAPNVSAHKDQDQPQSRPRKKRKKKRRGASTVSAPVIQLQLQSGQQQKSGKKHGVPTVSGPVIQHQQQSGSQQKSEKKYGIPVSAPLIQHQQQSGPQKSEKKQGAPTGSATMTQQQEQSRPQQKNEKKRDAPTGSATMTQQQEQSRPQQKNEKKRDAPIASGPKVQQQQRLQQRSEKKSGALTMSTAEQSVNKRRRTVVSADAPNASIGPTGHSIPSPHPYSTGGFTGQGATYFVPPLPRPYELAGFVPVDPHIIPYPERSLPYMPRDAPRESFYGGTAGYYDRGPSEYYAEYARIPSDGYDMPPFRHPSSMLFP